MELGIHFPNFTLPGEPDSLAGALASTAKTAEEVGCTTFTLMDHWFQMETMATRQEPMLEGYTSLGFLAGQTSTISLSLLVTGVTYRHPGLLAKIVTTLDVLSGGRASLGIGAAWYEEEHQGLGVPFPPVAERFERLEETLQICLQMWSDDDGPYTGLHYQLAETLCSPAADLVAPAEDPDRRRRREEDAAPRRPVRRRLQPVRLRRRRRCSTRSRCSPATARTWAATPPRSARPSSTSVTRRRTPTGSLKSVEPLAALGVELVEVMPLTPDPVAYAASLGPVVERLADL